MKEYIPLLVAGAILLVGIGVGVKRGAIRIGVSLLTTIVTFLLVTFATPYVAEGIRKYSPLDEVIQEQTIEAMLENKKEEVSDLESLEIPEEMQAATIQGLDLPKVFKILLLNHNQKETYQELGVTAFGSYVGAYLSNLVIKISAFFNNIYIDLDFVESHHFCVKYYF